MRLSTVRRGRVGEILNQVASDWRSQDSVRHTSLSLRRRLAQIPRRGTCVMTTDRQIEIDHNYDFFQRRLSTLLEDHRGEYALLKNKQIVGLYPGPGEAYRAGLAMFADEVFSIQEVRSEPIEMGYHAF
jgi:hypothetical protein